MGKKQVQKQLTIFVTRVRERLHPGKIILFGSYAKGRANEYSDIDVLVIAKEFSKMEKKRRFDILYQLTKDLYPDINAFGFTPDEVKRVSKYSILHDALKTGVELAT